jgi:uncharacterized protein with HEPN domain
LISTDISCIRDIRDAAHRATFHIAGLSAEALAGDPYLQDGVVRCLILIGEAAKGVSVEGRAAFAEMDWSGMIGLRNILVHRYQEIDYGELWFIVNRDLPPIVEKFTEYLARNA